MNKEGLIDQSEIIELLYSNAENSFSHTTYKEELSRFYLLAKGDHRAVDASDEIMNADIQGRLSLDPLRNYRYLFIVNTGLATRFAIEAGVPQELVYSTSDVFIRRADLATTIEEIRKLNREFWSKLVEAVASSMENKRYSRAVSICIDHITSEFNTRISLQELSVKTKLTPCYLASLFKKETGLTIGEYLTKFRIDAAKALLVRTDHSYSKIALSLGFCSQSYFTKMFRKITGLTPKEYRTNYSDAVFSRMII